MAETEAALVEWLEARKALADNIPTKLKTPEHGEYLDRLNRLANAEDALVQIAKRFL